MKKLYSIGNKKLGKDTMIFNITSATNCPAKHMCALRNKCYAMKAERMYPSVLPHRENQAFLWSNATFVLLREFFKATCLAHNCRYIRINESGDFRDQGDVDKLFLIADNVPRTFYLYTARRDLDFSQAPDNVVINGSGFMVHNQYNIRKEGPFNCPGYCRGCDKCKVRRGEQIYAKEH